MELSPLSRSPVSRSITRRKLARSVELPRDTCISEDPPLRSIPDIHVTDLPPDQDSFATSYTTGHGALPSSYIPSPPNKPQSRRRSIGEGALNKLSYLEAQHEISHSQLTFINKLGEGAFGEVWRAFLWDTEVAVKVLKGNFLRTSPLEELAEEVAMLK